MTDGEKMVWAAAYAVAFYDMGTLYESIAAADAAIDVLRDSKHQSRIAKEMLAADPRDVEAVLVDIMRTSDSNATIIGGYKVIEAIRWEIERRIGRPLRGAR